MCDLEAIFSHVSGVLIKYQFCVCVLPLKSLRIQCGMWRGKEGRLHGG